MANWVQCTADGGGTVLVNLSNIVLMGWDDHDECTYICGFDRDKAIGISEKPDAILAAANIDFDAA